MPSQPSEDEAGGPSAESIIEISTERDLVVYRRQIAARLRADPAAMRLLVINPVLAMRDVGVRIAPAVANHVLHSVQYPPEIRAEKDRLTRELTEALGGRPHPTDPAWLAHTVFVQLQVPAVDTSGATPAYLPGLSVTAVEAIQALLPTRGVTVDGVAQSPDHPVYASPAVRLACEPASVQELDLAAPVPALPPAPAPATLSVTNLWFYKQSNPLVLPLLRLGIIENSGVVLHGPANYRQIRSGEMANDLVTWVSAMRIPGSGVASDPDAQP